MSKRILILVLVIGILIFGAWYLQGKGNTENTPATPSVSYINANEDDITVSQASRSGNVVHVEGEARGPWYFEASFPIEVLDAQGNVIGIGYGTAQGEWMTTNFVPFTADVTLSQPYTGPAHIVLKKDNPSGEPQNDASLMYGVTL